MELLGQSSSPRRWRASLLVAAVVATIAAVLMAPPVRASSGTGCNAMELPVALLPGQPKTASIWGELCGAAPGRTVEVLTHGITYNHTYWDLPYQPNTYSYVRSANAGGRATFNYDRVGIGRSSHPPATDVTIPGNSYVLHQIVQALHSGQLGMAFPKVVTVGHSLGSLISMMEAGTYQDVDGVVLTGISHSFVTLGVAVLFPDFVPTQLDPVLAKRNFPLGYVTTRVGTREEHFYYAPTADPAVVALDEATKETGTAAELATIPTALPLSLQITAPVVIVNGDRDQLICGTGPCSAPLNPFHTEHLFYPQARSYDEVLLPQSGHDITLQTNAPALYSAVASWLDRVVDKA